MTKQIRFLFFDVGNVMVSDDPSALFIYRRLYERLGGAAAESPERFWQSRSEHAAAGGMLWSFVEKRLGNGQFAEFQKATRRDLYSDWETHSPAIPGMGDALHRLAADGWRMGVLANQPPEVERLLRARGLWDLFEVHAVSDVLGMSKPDPGLFRWALESAGVDPAETLMVGDRVDNDVAPAKSLGMRTLLLQIGFDARGWSACDDFGRLYEQSIRVHNISGAAPRNADEVPDHRASSPEELVEVISALRRG